MYKFNMEESFKKGWELTKKHWAVLLVSYLMLLVLGFIIGFFNGSTQSLMSGDFMQPENSAMQSMYSGWYLLVTILSYILSIWTGFNLYKMIINIVDGVKVKISDVFYYSKETPLKLWNYFLGNLLLVIIVGFGMILFIIPGIYFAVRFMFVPYLLIDKDMGIMDAFKKSSDMTRGEIWHLIGFSLLSFGIIIVGLIALLVGVIPAAILVSLTNVVIYRKLESHVHNLKVHTHTENA